jgi:hypothetical protein
MTKYLDLMGEHIRLGLISKVEDGENAEFWAAHAAFKVSLCSMIDDDQALLKLSKIRLYQVLAWCASYRPYEPHSMLTTFGRLAELAKAR